MNIFELLSKRQLALIQQLLDLCQGRFDLRQLVGADHLLSAQHAGMRNRTANVLRVQAMIETNAFAESFQSFVGGGLEYSAPRR